MSALQAIRRVTVYADQGHENALVEPFTRLGSKGYTITMTRGTGEHAALDDPFATPTHVRIELLVREAVADSIMDDMAAPGTSRLPITACVENVQFCCPENY